MTGYVQAVRSAFAGPAAGWAGAIGAAATAAALRAAAVADTQTAQGETILPAPAAVLRALALTPPDAVNIVILGQDPYPTPGDADGLAFSTSPGRKVPRSLDNIFRELAADTGMRPAAGGNLDGWAQQGVLLLNTCLTVPAGQAGGHRGAGWEDLTEAVISACDARPRPVVFILWGADARRRAGTINTGRHLVIESAHPSPLSARRGFFGSRPFSRANAFLLAKDREPVDWSRTGAA